MLREFVAAAIQLKFSDAVQDSFDQLYNLTDNVNPAETSLAGGSSQVLPWSETRRARKFRTTTLVTCILPHQPGQNIYLAWWLDSFLQESSVHDWPFSYRSRACSGRDCRAHRGCVTVSQ